MPMTTHGRRNPQVLERRSFRRCIEERVQEQGDVNYVVRYNNGAI